MFSTIDHALRLCDSPENDDSTPDAEIETKVDEIDISDNFEPVSASHLSVDTLVAALTLTREGSEEWILARIKSFNGKSCIVEDAEVEEEPSIEIAQKEYFNFNFLKFLK